MFNFGKPKSAGDWIVHAILGVVAVKPNMRFRASECAMLLDTALASYGANQEVAVVLQQKRSHGWYDYTVKTGGSQTEVRLAGRIETGKKTFTDPLMGRTV